MDAHRLTRRTFLKAGAVAAVGGTAVGVGRYLQANRPKVDVQRVGSYEDDLPSALLAAIRRLGLAESFDGRRVLLKPNLVETAPIDSPINTNPAVVVAAAGVFRNLGAREVFVAEGAGHRRDSELILDQSGLGDALDANDLRFVDLNLQEVVARPNRGGQTKMETLYLPKPLVEADLVVSMAKLKTHHWAGATLSMKNLFGVMPGIVYGWPKNRLHTSGIHQSIVDIVATVRPHLAIVDGIVAMEGDGPIMGTPKRTGVLVTGTNFPAVDATCCRIMQLDPLRVPYLALANQRRLGPITDRAICQTHATPADLQQDFHVLDHLADLKA
ncbi:MAG: DUF362 domain-containing protein [bacterium]|nr:DUF362 domain-containing protein [bacterium]